MRIERKLALAVVLGAVALGLTVGCSSGPKYSGFCDDYYKNLQPGPEGGAKERWVKPGVDWKKYNKLMVDNVTFYQSPDSEKKGIDPEVAKELADKFDQALVTALNPSYPFVAEPGPDVLRLRIALTDIDASSPTVSGITTATMILPIGLAVQLVKRGATGTWSGAGATKAEIMALDSQTNEVVAIAVDERAAGFTERYTKWGSAEEAFTFWAGRMKIFMDEMHGIAPPSTE